MKKMLIVLVSIMLLCGCQSKDKVEKNLKEVTDSYYENYIKDKVDGLDSLDITLGEIRELDDSKIDLSSVSRCSDDTKITATIEEDNIVDYKFDLKC